MKATYERPVEATLHVHLSNGETWQATSDDLDRFGLVSRVAASAAFSDRLRTVLDSAGTLRRGDLTEAQLNPLRYLVEIAICHPDLLDHEDMAETYQEIVAIERQLAGTGRDVQ